MWRDVTDSITAVASLWAIAWIVVVGGVGAALGASRAGRPLMGLLVSTFVPLPIVGWLIVIGVTGRSRRSILREPPENPFQSLIDDTGPG